MHVQPLMNDALDFLFLDPDLGHFSGTPDPPNLGPSLLALTTSSYKQESALESQHLPRPPATTTTWSDLELDLPLPAAAQASPWSTSPPPSCLLSACFPFSSQPHPQRSLPRLP